MLLILIFALTFLRFRGYSAHFDEEELCIKVPEIEKICRILTLIDIKGS